MDTTSLKSQITIWRGQGRDLDMLINMGLMVSMFEHEEMERLTELDNLTRLLASQSDLLNSQQALLNDLLNRLRQPVQKNGWQYRLKRILKWIVKHSMRK